MQRSDICLNPRHKMSGLGQERGFSIIELLVVLSLISLVTALVLPNLVTLYRNFSAALAVDDVVRQINGIGYKAYEQGQAYWLRDIDTNESVEKDSTADPRNIQLDLPEGWSLDVQAAVRYSANGACKGGHLKVFFQGSLRLSAHPKPPYCQVQ